MEKKGGLFERIEAFFFGKEFLKIVEKPKVYIKLATNPQLGKKLI